MSSQNTKQKIILTALFCACWSLATAYDAHSVDATQRTTKSSATTKVNPRPRVKAPAVRGTASQARVTPRRRAVAPRPVSARQHAVARVKQQLNLFVSARRKQPDHPNPRPFPPQERKRWKVFLASIETHMTKLPLPLVLKLRTVLENESDRDRNRFQAMPEPLSNRVIQCMSSLGLRMGLFRRPQPVVRVVQRKRPKKKLSKRVPNPSELPPLVFTQKDLERFKPPTSRLAWPIAGGRIGSGFGWRLDPFTRRRSFHGAVDIGAAYGSPVYAAEGGLVVRTGWMGTCGMGVVLQHSPRLRTYYCHLSHILAPSGKAVKRGQRIGSVGNSGRSTSAHLHFVVSLNGRAVNPADYLKKTK